MGAESEQARAGLERPVASCGFGAWSLAAMDALGHMGTARDALWLGALWNDWLDVACSSRELCGVHGWLWDLSCASPLPTFDDQLSQMESLLLCS